MGRKKGITDKQRRFVQEYLVDHNGTAAAIRAGYSPRSAKDIAYELLHNPDIRELIDLREAWISARVGISPERTKQKIACGAYANIRNIVDVKDGVLTVKNMEDISELDSASIQEIMVTPTKQGNVIKVKLVDQKGMLDLLCKIDGMYTDRLEVKDTTDRALNMKKARERVRNAQSARSTDQ
ncbi:Terminase small subunit [Sporomusa ovata DSM 2662]|uniref:Phage terminase small subunit n=1 Tax=Sporomusa ovata TaxID=2378 RepID=A0A0U1KV82_9FIRM|nr:terminase small subunit [Sporomusa ovata]EQB29329.1 phage terminase, small subunit [Sporomusa ovata DSM 2662]CQR71370.1 Phage terminase small subunit [Sporomusa ovata]